MSNINISLCFHSLEISYFLATFIEHCWPSFVSLGSGMDINHKSVVWLWTESAKNAVIRKSAVKQLVIINWNADCVCTTVPHINKDPTKNRISCISTSLFILKLIKRFEVRPDPAGTTVKPITRTLLCPAKPINLQFLDRRVEPRAAAGVSVWAVLVFTLCCLPFTQHLFIERSHHEDCWNAP